MRGKPNSNLQYFWFSLAVLPMAVLHLPMGQLLPNYYVNTTTVTFAALGAAALIARLFDAFSDPLIGYLSDRTKTRFGARKPWVMGGALLAIPRHGLCSTQQRKAVCFITAFGISL